MCHINVFARMRMRLHDISPLNVHVRLRLLRLLLPCLSHLPLRLAVLLPLLPSLAPGVSYIMYLSHMFLLRLPLPPSRQSRSLLHLPPLNWRLPLPAPRHR